MKIFSRLACVCAFTCVAAWGQNIAVSQIKGTVQDSSGLAVPGAEVRVTQTATGAVRNAVTGQDGGYIFPSLPVGPYRLEVSKQGFTTYVQSGIVLQVDSNPTIDAVLKVGLVTDQVVVEAGAALVETHSTGIGVVVDQQRVVDLPLNGRNATELIYLSGGANPGRAMRNSYANGQNQPSLAGGNSASVTYVMDGGVFNDPASGMNLPVPFPDALQEFKVETSALPAQYGYHSTGAVNGVTKSGANEIHGDLFEFVRNFRFNARDTFQLARDSLKRNQFGGTVGGPFVKNKLFYFFGYQGTVQRSNPPANPVFVPTSAMLNGDFTTVTSPACNNGRQINLTASQGFTGNRISPALFSAPAVKLAGMLPTTGDPCGRILFGALANQNEGQGLGRIDYQLGTKHTLFGRYFITHLEVIPGSPQTNFLYTGTAGRSDQVQSLVLGDTYLISPNFVSSFRVAGNRQGDTNVVNSAITLPDLGVKAYSLPDPKFITLTVTNGFSVSATPQIQPYDTIHVSEDLSLIKGAHQLGFGANFINSRGFATSYLSVDGQANFSGQITGLGNADFLMGKLNTFQQGVPVIYNQRQTNIALYLQDNWKVNPRLTVNAGLRWEPFLSPISPYNQVASITTDAFTKGLRSKVYVNGPAGMLFGGEPGGPPEKHYLNTRWNEFVPRLGIVWDPKGDGRMSVRAAVGIFNDFPALFSYLFGFEPPFGETVVLSGGDLANPWATVPGGNPFPISVDKNAPFPLYGLLLSFPSDIRPPQVQQWNLSLQKQMGKDWLLSASYIGNHTVHLWADRQINPAIYLPGTSCALAGVTYTPCSSTQNTNQRRLFSLINPSQGQYYGGTAVQDDGATASYHGLLLSAQKRLSGTFTVGANFTWSHCTSDPYVVALGLPNGSYTHPDSRHADRGNCITADRRRVFNTTMVAQSPKFSNRAANLLGGGWKMSLIVRALSGNAFTVTTGLDNALNGLASQRPNQILADPYKSDKGIGGWLNAASFQQPANGTFGNLGVNNVFGPGLFNVDVGLSRLFAIRERQRVEIRGEAFNLANHVNPNNPNATLTSQIFGQITADAGPRIMQFAVKYIF